MKKILITGAQGFIGSHLTELLLNEGYIVRATSHKNSINKILSQNNQSNPNLEVINGDITDKQFCNEICNDIDITFHLAALAGIPNSFKTPENYIKTNIIGTLNICKAALKNKVSKIIHTSSSDVYGNTKYVPTNEEHPLQAQSPYSASKIGAESLAMSFYYSSNLPLIIARPFNTYGPGQSALAIIPTIISQIASGKKQILLGDVTPTRDFSYITDTCNAFLLLAKCDNAVGEIVNIGSNTEISIMDLLNAIKELMHSDVEYLTETNRLRPVGSELKRVWCDNTKIKSLTGYKPEISLTEGLMNTIEWYSDKSRLAEYNTLYEAK